MSIVLEQISFNHDPTTVNHDALNIRKNASQNINVPEWREGYSSRPEDSLAAYSNNDPAGKLITIRAAFRSTDPQLREAEIRAIDPGLHNECCPGCTNVLGEVRPRRVEFIRHGHSTSQQFELV